MDIKPGIIISCVIITNTVYGAYGVPEKILSSKTCEPKAFSFQCMTKFTTNKKKKKNY